MKRTLGLLPLILIVGATSFLSTAGCASSNPTDAVITQQDAPSTTEVFGGTQDDTKPFIGLLNAPTVICSAVLLAPTVAVTSTHCVASSVADEGYLSCDSSNVGTFGPLIAPTEVQLTFGTQKATVSRIFAGKGNSVCSADLAYVILATPITGITVPPIQLDDLPTQNETITACGYGALTTKCDYPTSLYCSSGTVMFPNGGYYAPDQDTVPPTATLVSNHICLGDSGGPIIDSAGGIIGTASIIYNPDITKVPTTAEPCLYCDGSVGTYNLISQQRDLAIEAFAAAHLSPWREGHPKPVDVGAACTDALDCNSQLCVGVGAQHFCSQVCDTTACPTGTTCTPTTKQSVCLPNDSPHPASCSSAGTNSRSSEKTSGFAIIGFSALAAMLLAARRRSTSAKGGK